MEFIGDHSSVERYLFHNYLEFLWSDISLLSGVGDADHFLEKLFSTDHLCNQHKTVGIFLGRGGGQTLSSKTGTKNKIFEKF